MQRKMKEMLRHAIFSWFFRFFSTNNSNLMFGQQENCLVSGVLQIYPFDDRWRFFFSNRNQYQFLFCSTFLPARLFIENWKEKHPFFSNSFAPFRYLVLIIMNQISTYFISTQIQLRTFFGFLHIDILNVRSFWTNLIVLRFLLVRFLLKFIILLFNISYCAKDHRLHKKHSALKQKAIKFHWHLK